MTAPNVSTALAQVLVDELVRGGVRHLVIAPGSRSAAVAIAGARREDLAVSVLIDERSAGFFALGIGRATGTPAAVLTTSGSAVANLFPAVVEADSGSVPILLLTADRPPELHGTGANQTIDQTAIFGSKVRLSTQLGPGEHRNTSNDEWRALVCEAIRAAADGPVHMNLAFREPVVPETDDGRAVDQEFVYSIDGRPDEAPWSPAQPRERPQMVLDAPWVNHERGVVVCGEAPFASVDEIDRLAATLGWPLVAEPTIGGRPAQTVTTAHHLLSDPDLARRLKPDVALVIGRANLSRSVSAWLNGVPTLVVEPRISDPGRPEAVLADGFPVVKQVVERSGDWRRLWLRAEAIGRRELDRVLDEGAMTEPRIARDVAAAVPDGGVLLAASSMPIRDLDLAMAPRELRVLSNRGASGIDGFVSTAFGVAAASRGPVVGLAGDLAMLHDSNGFLVEPRSPVVFVVVNNNGGGIFSFLPQVRQTDVFEQVFATPHNRSFEMLAEFHGVGYELVSDVGSQVERAVASGGVWILEAVTDREPNPDIHRALSSAVARSVRESLES
jgi:2-succinyl-5-enolpyruvyl-6-hydroxy-3-cyclohexene-1-carboxylate synthase